MRLRRLAPVPVQAGTRNCAFAHLCEGSLICVWRSLHRLDICKRCLIWGAGQRAEKGLEIMFACRAPLKQCGGLLNL